MVALDLCVSKGHLISIYYFIAAISFYKFRDKVGLWCSLILAAEAGIDYFYDISNIDLGAFDYVFCSTLCAIVVYMLKIRPSITYLPIIALAKLAMGTNTLAFLCYFITKAPFLIESRDQIMSVVDHIQISAIAGITIAQCLAVQYTGSGLGRNNIDHSNRRNCSYDKVDARGVY